LAKTGTAEAIGEPYKTHGWFLGAFPQEQPRWAVMIFMKNAHGYMEPAALAGEIFQEIAPMHP
jgi:cell division protein FtsI/penicillin-binding protein 2